MDTLIIVGSIWLAIGIILAGCLGYGKHKYQVDKEE